MTRIAFFVSNDRHHIDMMRPVVDALSPRFACEVISLAELRGFGSPAPRFAASTLVRAVVPAGLRRSPSAVVTEWRAADDAARPWVRRAAWPVIQWRVRHLLRGKPVACAVLPNDAAFPFDGIAKLLRHRDIPFALMQEGIRFPLPGVEDRSAYGRGGAAAVCAWGESSAAYFRDRGVPASTIRVTGSPRYDGIDRATLANAASELRARFGLGERSLLLLTNPIDDQGFCTPAEKLALVRRFCETALPALAQRGATLALKHHGREDAAAYRDALRGLPSWDRIVYVNDAPLYPLLAAGSAAVVLASTVGLEALLMDLPLGVLEIPGAGFAHDYVASGAAVPIAGDASDAVAALLGRTDATTPGRAYVAANLAHRGLAGSRVAEVVADLAGGIHGIA